MKKKAKLPFPLRHAVIAAAGPAVVFTAAQMRGDRPDFLLYLFVFCAAFCTYSLSDFLETAGRPKLKPNELAELFFFGMIALLCASLFFRLTVFQQAFLLPAGFISLFYTLSAKRLKLPALRRIPYLKLFLIGGVWAAVSAVFPVLKPGFRPDSLFWVIFAQQFCYITALAVPFDIRDFRQDRRQKLQTLVGRFGPMRMKIFSSVLFGIDALLAGLFLPQNLFLAVLLSNILASAIVFSARTDSPDGYFRWLTDGQMFVRAAAVFTAVYFF